VRWSASHFQEAMESTGPHASGSYFEYPAVSECGSTALKHLENPIRG
jgi:hypothetical protein